MIRSRSDRSTPLWKNLALVIVSMAFACAGIEIGFRLLATPLGIKIVGADVDLLRSAFPAEYDPELGWVPRTGAKGRENVWGTEITIGPDGLRENGNSGLIRSRPLTVVVGDSFAFGDEVSDNETFCAHLERRTGSRVLNGGVFGYGIDQTYLRAMRLDDRYRPDVLIYSMITADVSRSELSMRTGVGKPYFVLTEGGRSMELRNVPVPRPTVSGRAFRRIVGYSHAGSFIVMKLFPEFWMAGTWEGSHQMHHDGPRILQNILRRLNDLAAERSMKVIVLIQDYPLPGPEDAYIRAAVNRVVDMIREDRLDRLSVVNMYPILTDIKLRDPDRYVRLLGPVGGHASSEGNALVAEELAHVLRERRR